MEKIRRRQVKVFIKKRLLLFKEMDVRGEILSNIGLGIFVNALFAITQKEYTFFILLDIFFGIMLITEGIIMKKDSKCN